MNLEISQVSGDYPYMKVYTLYIYLLDAPGSEEVNPAKISNNDYFLCLPLWVME